MEDKERVEGWKGTVVLVVLNEVARKQTGRRSPPSTGRELSVYVYRQRELSVYVYKQRELSVCVYRQRELSTYV
jgi:hypothetical protein